MTLRVHQVAVDEVEAYREIRLRALVEAPEAFATTVKEATARPDHEWADLVERSARAPDIGLWIAEQDGLWVALAGSYRPDHDLDAIELMQVWTDPAARRMGAARLVVSAVIEQGRTASPSEFGLWVAPGNEAAVGFYASLGFTIVADRAEHPPSPFRCDIRMRLEP